MSQPRDDLVVPAGEVERTFSESRAERIVPRLGSNQHRRSGGRVRGGALRTRSSRSLGGELLSPQTCAVLFRMP